TILARGPYLVRSARVAGSDSLALAGDTTAPTTLEVYAPSHTTKLSWNGRRLVTRRESDGALYAHLPGPRPVGLPALAGWRTRPGSPESDPGFDDSRWTAAGRGDLYVDTYGFHYGDAWYRGRFTATGAETALSIDAITGRAGAYAAWLNGTYLGAQEADDDGKASRSFKLPASLLHAHAANTIAVLLENSGHNEDGSHDDAHKQPRGITAIAFAGAAPEIAWRIAGNVEDDPARGPMNSGGQFGERNGWYLPGFPDGAWRRAEPGAHGAGVRWYRTTFSLHVPRDQDASIALQIDDTPDHRYRALIYVNGWLVGRYVNGVGPQDRFPLPNGILRTGGTNTLAISTWNMAAGSPDLGAISLKLLGNALTSLRVRDVRSPTYSQLFPR
ncbi:MAG: beta galactosidase jelly roll domain-containing protein, partial [Rhodanobacteraceae bacterium]